MINFPLSKEDWYKERDDRTNRVQSVKNPNFCVGVLVNRKVASSYELQVLTLITLNILARWCRNLVVFLEESSPNLLSKSPEKFKELIAKTIKDADPYVNLYFEQQDEVQVSSWLVLGGTDKEISKHVWADCSGWLSGVGRDIRQKEPFSGDKVNPVGAAFAACLANAELFREACGLSSHPYEYWYSLFDLSLKEYNESCNNPDFPLNVNLGRIHHVGCGAVGSSLVYLLNLVDWLGDIQLFDFDKVSYSNCNRSLLFTASDAASQTHKVKVCEEYLADSRYAVSSHEVAYSETLKRIPFSKISPDIIFCLANEDKIWASIQNNLPPLTYHATTTTNWGINFGRHIPRKEWCLLCRFSKEIEKTHTFVPFCSESVIKQEINGQPIQGVLPFLSVASAVILFAELAKLHLDRYPFNPCFVEFNFKNSGSPFLASNVKPDELCICQTDQRIEFYSPEVLASKYRALSI